MLRPTCTKRRSVDVQLEVRIFQGYQHRAFFASAKMTPEIARHLTWLLNGVQLPRCRPTPPSSRGLGRGPFKAKTGVRISLGAFRLRSVPGAGHRRCFAPGCVCLAAALPTARTQGYPALPVGCDRGDEKQTCRTAFLPQIEVRLRQPLNAMRQAPELLDRFGWPLLGPSTIRNTSAEVPPAGLEPAPQPPEGRALSSELWGHMSVYAPKL